MEELAQFEEHFDVVFASGLLYHLADPADFLRVIKRSCRGVVLIDNHIAQPDQVSHGCSAETVELSSGSQTYYGRTYYEFDPSATAGQRSTLLWAAWNNPTAFWPFEDELVRMASDAGFSSVEQIDMTANAPRWQVDQENRVVYICRV